MEMTWLDDFLAVAEDGGFSRAAERRHVTQPALSRRVRALEKWIGAPLFDRRTHTITLTPAGTAFRPVAEDVIRRLIGGREEALEATRVKAETISFTATHALSQSYFPDWICKVDAARNGSAVHLAASNFAGCERLLLEAQSHFLLAHHHPTLNTRLNTDRFQYIRLDRDVLIPISAPRSRSGSQRAIPRYKLPGSANAPLPYLACHPGSGVGRIVSAFVAAKEPAAALAPTFSAPVMLLIKMAREGQGITWAPRRLIQADLESGRLVRAGPKEWDIEVGICLFRSRARLSRVAEAFWQAIKKSNARQ